MMTFGEILESEYYYLVEAIEHGSSDPEIIEALIRELEDTTSFEYVLDE